MYNFIFYTIYIQQIRKQKSKNFARYNGSLIASIAFFLHVSLLIAVIKKFIGKYIDGNIFTDIVIRQKGLVILFLFAFLVFGYFYFNDNRINKIKLKYTNDINSEKFSGVKVIFLLAIPIILMAILLKK